MKSWKRGLAAMLLSSTLLSAIAFAAEPQVKPAQDALSSERDRNSYMVGMDVGRSIAPVGTDMDPAMFERAVRNAFDGGKPLLTDAEARSLGQSLMQRVQARSPAPGAAKSTASPPPIAKDKVGLLVGSDVGRSLAPIKDELDLAVFMRGVRVMLESRKPLLSETETNALRDAFTKRINTRMQAKATAAASENKAAGAAFMTRNKSVKGVFFTPSGLQYMVLRQGAGLRPKPTDRVRVNYHGTLLDGTVFDSSVDRGQPAEFALNQVIAGWTEGVSMMPVGAKYRFWIPAELAYGERGGPGGSIGPNATLVFDVELMSILQ
ncbi:MAG: FKBP-type peptidyl-prolyl cis-trans isomerase [Luteimonas sp.]